jgi:hypothetical protein
MCYRSDAQDEWHNVMKGYMLVFLLDVGASQTPRNTFSQAALWLPAVRARLEKYQNPSGQSGSQVPTTITRRAVPVIVSCPNPPIPLPYLQEIVTQESSKSCSRFLFSIDHHEHAFSISRANTTFKNYPWKAKDTHKKVLFSNFLF